MASRKSAARESVWSPGVRSEGRVDVTSERASFPLRVAAVDVGSNAIRFAAAEFSSPGASVMLDSERRPVRLGHDVFLSGRLTLEAMDRAVAALAGFRERMTALGVQAYRAVATSAVREASNGDHFVERVHREADAELEVITGSEEARLVHLAVKRQIPLRGEQWLLVDLGGGSVEVSLVDDRGVMWSESHTMGSVRLLEELAGAGEDPGRFHRLLEEYVSTLRVPSATRARGAAGLIATGGNIEALARLVGAEPEPGGVSVVAVRDLSAVIERLSRLSFRQRVDELGLNEDRADVILPAAMVYERLATLTGMREIHVPHVGVRDGVMVDLVDELTMHGEHEDEQSQLVLAGAVTLGRRYMFDEAHGTHVAELALSLFDQLTELHRLGDTDRRLLLAAGVLHDIGAYISYKRHHKHTLYLVSNSELPGFKPREMLLVANIGRYHRKSEPEHDHEAFMALSAADQERVRKLASLLRMADALDREHQQNVKRLTATHKGGELLLRLEGPGDLLLERWSLQRKSDFFSRVFDLKVRVTRDGEDA